jgi:alcohol dehydrogenase class IV
MRFEFATATRIIFGPGTVGQAGMLAASFGRKAFVVSGAGLSLHAPLLDSLASQGIQYERYPVTGEPTIDTVQRGRQRARQAGCDLVISIGGGSAIDCGKAIAALLANEGELLDYLEVIGQGKALTQPSVPFMAIPTTAGTGSEVTRNAVIGSPGHQVKASLRSPLMLPRLALIDPELTYSLPAAVTATTGLDALTQVIEPYVCNQPNPLTDAVCREGIQRAARALRIAYHNGSDPGAREDMCVVSLFGGLALANAKLGAAHGFAAPIGGMFPAPHGAICARLLPIVIETNLKALAARAPENPVVQRYDEVARLLTGSEKARALDGARWLRALVDELAIPGLSEYQLRSGDIPVVVEKAAKASSMQGNPIKLTADELREILEQAL